MAYLKCKQMADDDAYVQLLGLILFVVVNFTIQGGIVRQAMLQKRVYSPTKIQYRDDDRSRRGAHGKWDTIVGGR